MKILILGASYGSLFGTKCAMAGHDVTYVCTSDTAKLINNEGTNVRIKIKGQNEHTNFNSKSFPGTTNALVPSLVLPNDYDFVVLAMQEPQYSNIKPLMTKIGRCSKPCLSIMNMPPLPFIKRIPKLVAGNFEECYEDSSVWKLFEPGFVSLCSPDPQAFRPPEEGKNVLHVGLPTNFKAASFAKKEHNDMLRELERDISSLTHEGHDIPVKLRVFDSLFVPMAKWAMLMAGNYRCVMESGSMSIKEAVHNRLGHSALLYSWVNSLAQELGASLIDQVPFHKYAYASENLLKPSSVARALDSGVHNVERVDLLVKKISEYINFDHNENIDEIVRIVDYRLLINKNVTWVFKK